MAEGPAQEEGARRSHLLSDIPKDGEGNRGNTSCLDTALDQSHGPITKPSSRGEENKVWLLGPDSGHERGQYLSLQRGDVGSIDVSHE